MVFEFRKKKKTHITSNEFDEQYCIGLEFMIIIRFIELKLLQRVLFLCFKSHVCYNDEHTQWIPTFGFGNTLLMTLYLVELPTFIDDL